MRSTHPESAGRSPGATFRNVAVALLVVVVTGLAAFGWEWMTAETVARRDADIARKIAEEQDAPEQPPSDIAEDSGSSGDEEPEPDPEPEPEPEPEPFDPEIWSYTEPLAPVPPGPGVLLLDDLDEEAVERFQSAEYDEAGFEELQDWVWSVGDPLYSTFGQESGLSNRWNLTLNSDGQTAVTVTDLRLAGLECVPARATVAFALPDQGASDRLLISYSMEAPELGRLYEYTEAGDHAPGWGAPFFAEKVVNLGGAEEGVGLVVEVVTTTEDCTWSAFEVAYQGPDGGGTYEVESDTGEPFEARGVAANADTFSMFHDENNPDVYAHPLW